MAQTVNLLAEWLIQTGAWEGSPCPGYLSLLFLSPFTSVCVCVHECVGAQHMCTHGCDVHICIWGSEVEFGVFLDCFITLLIIVGSQSNPGLAEMATLGSQLAADALSFLLSAGLQVDHYTHLAFLHGF